jgi:hypothetical protein
MESWTTVLANAPRRNWHRPRLSHLSCWARVFGWKRWQTSAPMISALDEGIHQHDEESAQLVLFCTAPNFQALNSRRVLLNCDAMRWSPPDDPGEATCTVV